MLVCERYAHEICELTHERSGWHFNALRATAERIDNFHIEEMATQMQAQAPEQKNFAKSKYGWIK
jgi:hypothetical protein